MMVKWQKIDLLKDDGADENNIITARAKYKGTSNEYSKFYKDMNWPHQRYRVTVDGGVGKYKKQLTNW